MTCVHSVNRFSTCSSLILFLVLNTSMYKCMFATYSHYSKLIFYDIHPWMFASVLKLFCLWTARICKMLLLTAERQCVGLLFVGWLLHGQGWRHPMWHWWTKQPCERTLSCHALNSTSNRCELRRKFFLRQASNQNTSLQIPQLQLCDTKTQGWLSWDCWEEQVLLEASGYAAIWYTGQKIKDTLQLESVVI